MANIRFKEGQNWQIIQLCIIFEFKKTPSWILYELQNLILNFFPSKNRLKKPTFTVLSGYKTNSVSTKITVFILSTKKLYIQYVAYEYFRRLTWF